MTHNHNISNSITVKSQMRKNPHLYKHFIEISSLPVNSKFTEIDIIDLYSKIKKYSSLIKSKKINLLEFKSFEEIEDTLTASIHNNEADKLLKSLISNKYRFLVNEETHNIIFEINHNEIDREHVKHYVNKIASFKNPENLNSSLKKCLIDNTNNNINEILKRIKEKKLNVNISYVSHKEKILIIKINDYHASKELGSGSWCISYNPRYFNMYINKKTRFDIKANQFFVFDFNSEEERYSLIGVTASIDKLIFAADKRDVSISLLDKYKTKPVNIVKKVLEINSEKYHNTDRIVKDSIKKVMGNTEDSLNYLNYVINEICKEKISFSEDNLILLSHTIERFTQKGLYKKSFKIFSKILMKEIENGYIPSKELLEVISKRNKGFAIKLAHKGIKVNDQFVNKVVKKWIK